MVRLATTLLFLTGAGLIGLFYLYDQFSAELPDYVHLSDYRPPTVTRVHAGDGRILAEFASERRVFVPVEAMPRRLLHAFLAAEDKNFYTHPGVDMTGILRAALTNLIHAGSEHHPMGASTITQQVAKNFLLTNEVSYTRKIKEAILALRIEQALSKDRILELYLNEIYLGNRSYGVAAAALNYFDKSLDELSIAECAFLASLPKAPNTYGNEHQHKAALARRDWVIGRMAEDGAISAADARVAVAEPLAFHHRTITEQVTADYYAEEVRRELARHFGDKQLYEGGLSVRTPMDPRLQEIVERSLRTGLSTYDHRHGWHGTFAHLPDLQGWPEKLAHVPVPKGAAGWRPAVVLETVKDAATIGFVNSLTGRIPFSEMRWMRPALDDGASGPEPRKPADALHPGDVLLVEAEGKDWSPRQIPDIQGGVVAMDPHTGRVLAMSGGFSPAMSQFNRATQAMRQPGSAFKPFVYLTALDNGFTPSSLILDAPFVYDPGHGAPIWRPENYHQDYYGPTPLRVGIEKSRNLMTVRLADHIGMDKVKATVEKFGVVDNLQPLLPMALGAAETTVLRMVTAYSMLVNGGKRVTPAFIDRVQDRNGKTLYRHDDRTCAGCAGLAWTLGLISPDVPDTREQIEDPRTCYQIVNIMTGVVQRGTAARLAGIGRPLGGKTGTTNDSNDAWFVGFTPDLVVGLYVGFDQPRSLGGSETGASTAVPIFQQIITEGLKGVPAKPFRVPPGLRQVRIDPATGRPAEPGDHKAIWEAYIPGTEPGSEPETVLGGNTGAPEDAPAAAPADPSATSGTGGIY